jgi:hypothetical protein
MKRKNNKKTNADEVLLYGFYGIYFHYKRKGHVANKRTGEKLNNKVTIFKKKSFQNAYIALWKERSSCQSMLGKIQEEGKNDNGGINVTAINKSNEK